MKRHFTKMASLLLIVPLIFTQVDMAFAAIKVPEFVKDISRQNTYPNPDMDPEYVQPSASTVELFKTTNYKIENPNLIRLLNETSINPSPFSIGFRANIYLGNWALNYESKETSVNWEYKEANLNQLDNRGGNTTTDLTYEQKDEFTASGGLTTEVISEDDVKKLMIAEAKTKTGLNLAFRSTIGKGTKQETIMRVPPRKIGYLHALVPAASERGNILYGEVYLNIKGTEKKLIIKNVTHKGVGAWIPVQDKLTFKYILK
ncbi:MAG TPA: YfkD family protein [Bacillota bacterium]|nr:YfkD family protein [Bacillota bacterium]